MQKATKYRRREENRTEHENISIDLIKFNKSTFIFVSQSNFSDHRKRADSLRFLSETFSLSYWSRKQNNILKIFSFYQDNRNILMFCSVLFCSVLFCSVLFCSVLFCSVLFYVTQLPSASPSIMLSTVRVICDGYSIIFLDLDKKNCLFYFLLILLDGNKNSKYG